MSSDSCVEIFIKPEGSDEYWNFEFNCAGVPTPSHRRTAPEPVSLTAERPRHNSHAGPKATCPTDAATPRTWRHGRGDTVAARGHRASGRLPRFKANVYACALKACAHTI